MTVKEFIQFLESQPQDIQVAHQMCSEFCLLDKAAVSIMKLKLPMDDGWIHYTWSSEKDEDVAKQKYLVLPGN